MPSPTIPSVIRADFIAAIEGIVPAETEHGNRRLRYTQSVDDIPGSTVRTFTLRLRNRGDGPLIGCGNDYTFDLEVHVSYHGLQHAVADCLIVEDHRQIFQTLALRAGSLTGLQGVQWDGPFEYGSEEEGKVYGHHRFLVRYIASADP